MEEESLQPPLKPSIFVLLYGKQQNFRIAHRRTHHRLMTPNHAPQPHVPQIPCVYKYFACEMVLSAQELCVIEKMAIAGMGNKKMLPQSTTKRWLQRLRSEGEMVSHNVGRPRGEEAGLCLVFLGSQPTSLQQFVICAVVQWVR